MHVFVSQLAYKWCWSTKTQTVRKIDRPGLLNIYFQGSKVNTFTAFHSERKLVWSRTNFLSVVFVQWWRSTTTLETKRTSCRSRRAPSSTWSRRTTTAGTRAWWAGPPACSPETTWSPSCTTPTEPPLPFCWGVRRREGGEGRKANDFSDHLWSVQWSRDKRRPLL